MASETVQTPQNEHLTYHLELDEVRRQLARAERMAPNISGMERIASGVVGAGLTALGISRRSIPGVLLALTGIALLERGATGHCGLYEQLGIDTSRK